MINQERKIMAWWSSLIFDKLASNYRSLLRTSSVKVSSIKRAMHSFIPRYYAAVTSLDNNQIGKYQSYPGGNYKNRAPLPSVVPSIPPPHLQPRPAAWV